MLVGARLDGRHDEEPFGWRVWRRRKQFKERLLVAIADAVRLARILERLGNSE